jgi:hypothetical protein
MFELLALALLQFSTIFSSPAQQTQQASGGSSGWGDGNVTTQSASGGSSGWGDGNVTVKNASGGSSGWGDGNM